MRTYNLHNTVHQLYFNFLKKEKTKKQKQKTERWQETPSITGAARLFRQARPPRRTVLAGLHSWLPLLSHHTGSCWAGFSKAEKRGARAAPATSQALRKEVKLTPTCTSCGSFPRKRSRKQRKSEGFLISAAVAQKCVMQYCATEKGWGCRPLA